MTITRTLALALASLPLVIAQTTYDVQVGPNGTLVFDPETVVALPGDVIEFQFTPGNHSVIQSTFATPCVHAIGGANSGFVIVANGTDPLPTIQYTVPPGNETLWFYCGQQGHCGQGMVFAINPPSDPSAPNSYSAYKAAAIGEAATPSSALPSQTFSTPPAPQWESATATVTWSDIVYTTTYSSYAGTPPPTPAAQPVDHKILVGFNGTLTYSPPSINASINDTVTFEFYPKNHTVTQSSFLNPCESLEETSRTPGFDSGFVPVAANATSNSTFQITINDTSPIWGYCGQVGHCQAGMVFAINAVEFGPNNFEAFLAIAKTNASATATASTATETASKSAGVTISISHRLMWAAGLLGVLMMGL